MFAGGGTGGHLYPALAVAEGLRDAFPNASVAFVGAERGLEARLVPEAGYPFRGLAITGLKGFGPAARAAGVARAGAAVARCLYAFGRDRPDAVIGVGGYASGPAVLSAVLSRIPTVLLEQNHYPGATNRHLARFVDRVCVPSAEARRRLGDRGEVTGNPVRAAFHAIADPEPKDRLNLLVFGGSGGASRINRAVADALPSLARFRPPVHVVHQTGASDEAELRDRYARSPLPNDRHEVRAFLDDMPERMAWADLVICRAGATTLSELAAAGRPAVLVPYPYAADDHQRHNAEAVERVGAARVVLDRELDAVSVSAIVGALADAPERRLEMGRAARRLAVPDATERIVRIVSDVIGVSPGPDAGALDGARRAGVP